VKGFLGFVDGVHPMFLEGQSKIAKVEGWSFMDLPVS